MREVLQGQVREALYWQSAAVARGQISVFSVISLNSWQYIKWKQQVNPVLRGRAVTCQFLFTFTTVGEIMKTEVRNLFLKNSQGLGRYIEQFQRASISSKITLIVLSSAVLLSLTFAIGRSTQAPDHSPLPAPALQQSSAEQTPATPKSSQPAGPVEALKPPPLQEAVSGRLEQWRSAWEGRNADLHMSFFHPSFDGLKFYDQNRRKRIQEAKSIEVKISDIAFKPLSETEMLVVFVQAYKSDRFSDRVKKEQVWRDTGNGPLIVSERVVR